MKALTICQPYADLICLPDDDPRAKRVENRNWRTDYRGPLLIHAGKSLQWLRFGDYGIDRESMVFGAIIGIADVVECFHIGDAEGVRRAIERWPWLATHEHVSGACCFVLENCRRFKEPIPYRGAQGFFDVPRDVVDEAIASLEMANR